MKPSEICYLVIARASELIANKQLSPVEVINAHLERVAQTDEKLNSFITLLADESLDAAREAEKSVLSGTYLGPLHGLPVGLKDLYYTKGIRTTIGSKILREFVPEYDAAVTAKFKQAGAIILGKLQMHEFALGGTSENPHDGPAHNPWDIECMTGGSSGGSGSAVASGQCMAALGSDTGGSIRIPASLCGIVGLKPTFGRVSRHGVYPLCWSLDTAGPMTRTVRDAALVLNAIAGHDGRDPSSSNVPVEDFTAALDRGVEGIRVGIPKEYFFDVIDPEVRDPVFEASRVLQGLGASVDEVSIPALDHSFGISTTIMMAESAELHLEHLRTRADDIGADVRGRLELGAMLPAIDYIKAQRARSAFNMQVSQVLQKFDILLAPSTPISAPKLGQTSVMIEGKEESALFLLPRLTRSFNISGSPTISVPCGFTSSNMPIGVQLAGRLFDEATVLRVAHAYEQATEWHTRRPSL